MPETISGFDVKENQDLDFMKPILEEWILCIQRFCRVSDDAPYWYNEACNVSVLGASAWRCGFAVLSESSVDRSEKGSNGEYEWHGRADLRIVNEHLDCYVEAKQSWPESSKVKKMVESDLAMATEQVNSILIPNKNENENNKNVIRLSISFCGLRIPVLRIKESNKLILEGVISARGISCDALAWCFPCQTRDKSHEEWIYPGIMVLARKIDAGQN